MKCVRLLAIVLALSCAGTPKNTVASAGGPAVSELAGKPRAGRRLMVVGINDTHGALLAAPPPKALGQYTQSEIGGADWLAGYLAAIRADYAAHGDEVVVLDAGDVFQGTLISNEFRGKSVVEAYNLMGLTAEAVGNHDFDFGIPVLKERIAESKFPWIAANIFLKGTTTRPDWAKPSVLVERGGIKIGVVGLATRETALVTNPANVDGLDFADGGPIAAAEADALRARGATVVLIVAHAGPLDGEIQRIAKACSGKVDAIVSGHHHLALGAKAGEAPLVVANIPIVQSGHKLQNFSTIELKLDENDRVREFAVNDGNFPKPGGPQPLFHIYNGQPAEWRGHKVEPDGRVSSLLRDYDQRVRKLRETRIGETQVALYKGSPKDDLLANLTTDALRSGVGGSIKANFSFQNSGGLRVSEIPAGPITFGQIFDLYPFDNQQFVVSLSANQVRDALEAILHAGKAPLRVSGMHYVIDWDKFGAKDLKQAPPGAIVTKVFDDATNDALCETKSCTQTECVSTCRQGTYTVSVTDFLANGGDGLTMLKDAPRQTGSVFARDIIVEYVKSHQPLTAELLGAGKPRIEQHGASKRQGSD